MTQAADFSSRVDEVKQQYLQEFDPKQYHHIYYSAVDDEVKFFLRSYHEVFSQESLLTSRPRSQRRVLEFGCGPVPVYSATSAFYTDSLTMAEIIPSSRFEIEAWMNNMTESLDWAPYFNYLASLQTEKTQEEIVERVREVFQMVLPCDGGRENPLYPVCQKFDVVMTTLCLEFATTTPDDHTKMLSHVANLLKADGILLMAGALGNTTYSMGTTHYPSVSLTKTDLELAIKASGLRLVSLSSLDRQTSCEEKPADHRGVFFLVAQNQRGATV